MELLDSVVNRNFTLSQECLKSEPIQFRKTTSLSKSEPLLLKKCERQFSLQLRFAEMGGLKHFIWNRDWHNCNELNDTPAAKWLRLKPRCHPHRKDFRPIHTPLAVPYRRASHPFG